MVRSLEWRHAVDAVGAQLAAERTNGCHFELLLLVQRGEYAGEA